MLLLSNMMADYNRNENGNVNSVARVYHSVHIVACSKITLTLFTKFSFYNPSDLNTKFHVSFHTQSGWDNSSCFNPHISKVDDRTQDIYCSTYRPVHKIQIYGPGVKKLCHMYISQGKNNINNYIDRLGSITTLKKAISKPLYVLIL